MGVQGKELPCQASGTERYINFVLLLLVQKTAMQYLVYTALELVVDASAAANYTPCYPVCVYAQRVMCLVAYVCLFACITSCVTLQLMQTLVHVIF